jgi:hypothetical protein
MVVAPSRFGQGNPYGEGDPGLPLAFPHASEGQAVLDVGRLLPEGLSLAGARLGGAGRGAADGMLNQ